MHTEIIMPEVQYSRNVFQAFDWLLAPLTL